ncbi:Uma2 family endonuclease [Leptolyngbya sp. PL-A3]|uniref:Uma2 family endonuclease n=1 Tax=Leptolyngbya sp. PL-A3 TaxID=2933911 RepID=UPI003297056B
MVQAPQDRLTLEAFLALPEGDVAYELINGVAVPKTAPQRFHSRTQKALLLILEHWGRQRGEVGIEWAVTLKREGKDWVPVPALLFVSQERLPKDFTEDGPCPVLPDLAVEIISPDQTFGGMTEKALDYFAAGVLRVWIVDPKSQSITVFVPDRPPQIFRGDRPLTDPLLPDLSLNAQYLFQEAGIAS